MENPAIKLAPIVSALYDASTDTGLTAAQQKAAYLRAAKLRGMMVTLIAKQFNNATPEYTAAMTEIKKLNDNLKQAADAIDRLVKLVKGAADVVKAVEGLVGLFAGIAAL